MTGRPHPGVRARALSSLPRAAIEAMLRAGDEVLECTRVLAKADLNVVGECLKNQGTFYEFEHYPHGDVYDDDTHSQYYYHAHRGLDAEHGHFHTFVRAPGMPAGVAPLDHDGDEPWPRGDDALSHLVAVSMDRYGDPIGMFTTNRWVTGETWYPAADVVRMLDGFSVDHAHPSWPVNRWITAMLRLFRPTVEALLAERDEALRRWRGEHPGRDPFEDRELEITSATLISVEEQIDTLRRAVG